MNYSYSYFPSPAPLLPLLPKSTRIYFAQILNEGAYADIILVDGNPLKDLNSVTRQNVDFVMKDGKIYKNTLE